MSQEFPQTTEALVQITPEERAEFDRINAEVENTFNFIFELYDQLEEEDKNNLLEFLEHAGTLAGKFKTVFDEVSDDDHYPQSSVTALLKGTGKMRDQLVSVKEDLESKMKALGYEINTNFTDEVLNEPVQQVPEEKEVVSATEAPVVPPVIPEAIVPETVEPEREAESEIEKLTQLYKMADQSVFNIDDGQGQLKRKPFKVIRSELKTIFEGQKYGEYGTRFLNEIIDATGIKIAALNAQKKSEKAWKKRDEANRLINGLYQDLLEDVAVFMQTVKVDIEDGVSPEAPLPEESLQDVEREMAAAVETFKTLSEELPDDNPLRQSPEFLATAQAVIALEAYHEEDPVRAAADKQRMNKVLQKTLHKLIPILGQNFTHPANVFDAAATVLETHEAEEGLDAYEVIKSSADESGVDTQAEAVAPEAPATEKVVETEAEVPPVVEEVVVRKNEALFSAKREYREKQQAYKTALADFYEQQKSNSTLRSRVGASLKKIVGLGIEPELPPAILAMQNEYKQLRSVYAESLDKALVARSERAENKEYSLASDATKVAYGKKFILKPNQEILALQEKAVLYPEMQAMLGRVMMTMSKHKWAMRIGIVTAAGIAGGLTGGVGLMLAGAGLQASKMTISAGAGAAAGYGANRLTQRGVDKASAFFDNKSKEFTLADLDAFETELLKAQSDVKSAKTRQKVATVGAAVLAGGATGFASGQFGQEDIAEALGGNATEVAGNIETEVAAPVAEAPDASAAAAETIPTVEIQPIAIDEIKLSYESFRGNIPYKNVLHDISLGADFNAEALGIVEQAELISFIKIKAEGLLAAHPSMSETTLEAELFKSVQAKFGATDWWSEAKISHLDIGKFDPNPAGGVPAGVESAAPVVEQNITGGFEAPQTYVVGKGDSLSQIVEKKFSADLKGLTPVERNAVFDKLFDKIQNSPELKSALGLRSGDVDLVYAGEKLNLSVLESELDKVLGQNGPVGEFTRSAPVAITPDAGVQNIPITVVENTIPVGTEVVFENMPYTEAAPGTSVGEAAAAAVTPEAPTLAPRPFSLNGQYAEHPEYREYITKVFGSGKEFEQAVERSVASFDKRTYDIFDSSSFLGGGNYESPYRLLGDMSLQEVTEFEAQSNDEIRYFLTQNNIKYDTYLAWLDQIDYMVKNLPNNENTTVADLFARYVTETHIPNKILSK